MTKTVVFTKIHDFDHFWGHFLGSKSNNTPLNLTGWANSKFPPTLSTPVWVEWHLESAQSTTVCSLTGPNQSTPPRRTTRILYLWGPVGGQNWHSSRGPRGAYFEILNDVGPFGEMKGISEPQIYKCLGQLEVHVVFFRLFEGNSTKRKNGYPKKAQKPLFWPFFGLFSP